MGEGRRGGEQAQEGDAARIKKQDPKPEAWSSPDFQRNRDYILSINKCQHLEDLFMVEA